MNNITAFSGLDDEEDLEALRLIALQSLKKNAPLPDGSTLQTYPQQSPEHLTQFWQNKGFRNKKGKAFGVQYSNRGNRTGHFNTHFNRVRSTNLISIPTLPADTESDDKPSTNEVKLNLPQNRYCINDDGDKSQDSSSKFDRYNNSDKSESESEDETDVLLSDEEGPPLKKSNSLEALMQELDKEIEGKVAEEKTKTKKTKKRKKETSTSDTPNEGVENAVDETDKPKNTNDSAPIVSEVPKEPVSSVEEENQQLQNEYGSPMKKRLRPGSPNRRNFYNRRRQRNYQMQQQNNPPVMMPYGPGPVQYPPQMLPFNGQPFNPMYGPPGMMPNQPIPPYFENSLPPLTINTEPLPGPTLAPLSPRSAAFVMENKAIIERRRRSPRRSYSRSPSRSPTRSLTPRRSPRWSISPRRSPVRRLPPRKRSLTPKRKSISPRKKSLTPRRKSVSPRRLSSPSRRKSLSPKRKSLSPRRRSVSPRRRSLTPRRQSPLPRSPNRKKSVSPKRKAGDGVSSRAPVRDRLGVKSKTEEKEKPKQAEEPVKKDEKPLDPILEARKRKFESNEIKMKEGIIRLRPKDEKPKDDAPKEEKPIEIKQKETKPNPNKTKDERPKVDKPKEEPVKPEKPKPQIDIKIEKTETEPRSTTPKPKESIVEVAPATTTTEDKQIDVPDEFKELEKLLLGGDDLELVPKVEDIFSDEDSASDNEGRFKVKEQKTGAKPPVISFSKLVNGEKREIKSEPLAKYTKNREGRERSDRDRLSHRSRTNLSERRERKEPTIFPEKEKKKSPEKTIVKSLAKHRAPFRTERPPPVMDKRFERKIEIKIKNPSKYERSGKSKIVSKNEVASSSSSSTVDRKISVEERMSDSTVDEDDEETEPEMIVDNGSDEEYSNFNEGDLRAQLSKKRAEKLHKIPVEQVSKRLLDYALKGAVYKKSKKKSKDKDIIICEGKPPIHLRLGTGNELYPELRVKRKSRKRKNREILEQLEYHVIEK